MSFQKIILVIAIILLIITLVMFGIAIHNFKRDEKFPPVQAVCPDYWKAERDEKGETLCENVHKLGNSSCQTTMNFSKGAFAGPNGSCNKKKWASACGITWDGITNSPQLC